MFALVMTASFLVPVDQPKELSEAGKKELKTLQGKWKAVKVLTSNGEQVPTDNDPEMIVEFKGRTVIAEGKDRADIATLDPSTTPKCIDLKSLAAEGQFQKGALYEGIYKIDGDTLSLALHVGEEKKRPANFDAPKEEKTIVIVLKRVKD